MPSFKMKKLLTCKEAAYYLGIPEEELEKMVFQGKMPAYKIGGVYTRFKLDDLNSYRRNVPASANKKRGRGPAIDSIKDFFYFNDFYILSGIAGAIILYFIFK
ncbi:excisionase family DNA-binding protein [Candidatus Omnitrophota bacterium]